MPDLAVYLEPFLLVARSTKGAAAAKVIMDATAAPGVYGFGELLDMPNIKQLREHETLSSHYNLLQLFAYGTFELYQANQASYPPLSPAQIDKLKHLSLVSLGMESRSLTYASLLSVLEQPSVRALEDMIIDAIYAGIIAGRMDQVNGRFSVDWVVGRDLDVGGSELRDLGMRLENWCEMTQDLLSSLDTAISQSRARTIATHGVDQMLQHQRFAAYEAYTTGQKSATAGSAGRKSKQQPGIRQSVNASGSAGISGWSEQAAAFEKQQLEPQTSLDPRPVLSHTRNTRAQGRRCPGQQGASREATQQGGGATAGIDLTTSEGSSRIRTLSGTTASQDTEATKRVRRGNK